MSLDRAHKPVHVQIVQKPAQTAVPIFSDLDSLTRYMTVAYALATLILCGALVFSYFTLKNILVEQSLLHNFGATTSELRSNIRNSTVYLSDLKTARALPESESRLETKIEAKLLESISEIKKLTQETSDQLRLLGRYNYFDSFNDMFNGPPANISTKLNQYIVRLDEITTDTSYGAPDGDLLWLPVEATAAKNGALGKSYESALGKLQSIIKNRFDHLTFTHRNLTLLSLLIVALQLLLIFLPLKKRLKKVNTKLHTAHKDLFQQANFDEQTGLPNTTGILKSLKKEDGTPKYSSLLIVSLENSDTISRIVGPTALGGFFRSFVARLNSIGPSDQMLFRAGDSEFGILRPSDKDYRYSNSVLSIKNQLNNSLTVENAIVHPLVRLGYSQGDISSDSFSNFLIDARLSAQHYIHESNTIPLYDALMRSNIEDENLLVEKIRVGLENNEFVPHYQIKVDAKTGLACGMEALCRWKQSDGSLVAPSEFIPVAEKSGLIAEITWTLLEQISNDYRVWIENGLQPGRVAFNAANLFLRDPDYTSRITKLVIAANTSANTASCPFDLELTENVTLGSDKEAISNAIDTARELGMGIALDDFGTGYASLSSIVGLDVDIIKIDQSFVKMMSDSPDSKTIVLTIIHLCQQLKKKCVVEGVETKEQWEFCRDLGCDEIQGYYFHKPAPASYVLDTLTSEQSLRKTG